MNRPDASVIRACERRISELYIRRTKKQSDADGVSDQLSKLNMSLEDLAGKDLEDDHFEEWKRRCPLKHHQVETPEEEAQRQRARLDRGVAARVKGKEMENLESRSDRLSADLELINNALTQEREKLDCLLAQEQKMNMEEETREAEARKRKAGEERKATAERQAREQQAQAEARARESMERAFEELQEKLREAEALKKQKAREEAQKATRAKLRKRPGSSQTGQEEKRKKPRKG